MAWVLAGVVAALALWCALNLVYVSTGNETGNASPADVVIVLGCPSYEGNVLSAPYAIVVRQVCIQIQAAGVGVKVTVVPGWLVAVK